MLRQDRRDPLEVEGLAAKLRPSAIGDNQQEIVLQNIVAQSAVIGGSVLRQLGEDLAENPLAHEIIRVVIACQMIDGKLPRLRPCKLVIEPMPPLLAQQRLVGGETMDVIAEKADEIRFWSQRFDPGTDGVKRLLMGPAGDAGTAIADEDEPMTCKSCRATAPHVHRDPQRNVPITDP